MAGGDAITTMEQWRAAGLTETVVYRPVGGDSRQIQAVVDRDAPAEAAGNNATGLPLRLTVLNDGSLGVSSAELDRGGDGFDVPELPGRATARRLVVRVESADDDWLMLAVI